MAVIKFRLLTKTNFIMKKNYGFIVALSLTVAILFSSCYGPFKLTQKLHEWNGSLGDKWVNALVFFGLNVVPVYGISVTIDAVVLNTIEFWTGDNPVSMKEGAKDEKIVKNENGTYKITAKRNHFIIEGLDGVEKGKVVKLKINPETKSLYLEDGDQLIKLAEYEEEQASIRVFKMDGSNFVVNPEMMQEMAVAR